MKRTFHLPSKNTKDTLFGVLWLPDGKPKAVLQIAHGMTEYIERYEPFAEYLNAHDFAVIGYDHAGHGKSACTPADLGYFADRSGCHTVIADMASLTHKARHLFPDIPLFLLGHSMGSFFTRKYMAYHSHLINGVILMGTGYHPFYETLTGEFLSWCIQAVKGSHYKSRLLTELALGNFNRHFAPNKTAYDWISRDEDIVSAFAADELCTFRFTTGAYLDFFRILSELAVHKNFEQIPKTLPLCLVSGRNDPVGGFGKGVRKVYLEYRRLGLKDISFKLYDGARHEILNELQRPEVFFDLLKWMENRI